MADKAILLDLGVFLADNNVRRNIATVRVNAQSTNGDVNQRDTNVLPGGSYSYTSLTPNKLTVIKASKPVLAEINQGSTSYSVVINSLYVTSDAFTSLVLNNSSISEPSQVTIIQV